MLERGAFKTRAAKLSKLLEDAGITVTINPSKPRKGSFVVTVESDQDPLLELLDMPRPFNKLKALDIDEVAKDLILKIKK